MVHICILYHSTQGPGALRFRFRRVCEVAAAVPADAKANEALRSGLLPGAIPASLNAEDISDGIGRRGGER